MPTLSEKAAEEINKMSDEELGRVELGEVLALSASEDFQKISERVKTVLLKGKTLPIQMQIQLAWQGKAVVPQAGASSRRSTTSDAKGGQAFYYTIAQMSPNQIADLKRSDLEARPIAEFKGLTKDQAIAVDAYVVGIDKEQAILENLQIPQSRPAVEMAYALQKPFPVRWSAQSQHIEYHFPDPITKSFAWSYPDGSVYAEALQVHDEFHVKREKINSTLQANPSQQVNPTRGVNQPYDPFASPAPGSGYGYDATSPFLSGQSFPYPPQRQLFAGASGPGYRGASQTNVPETPNPQLVNEKKLSGDLFALANRQVEAAKIQLARAKDEFRQLAQSNDFNLTDDQTQLVLNSYENYDINLADSHQWESLDVPKEYLMSMAQRNIGLRPLKIPGDIERLIDNNRPFFLNHKYLSEAGVSFERRAPLLKKLNEIRDLDRFSKDCQVQANLSNNRVVYLGMRKASRYVETDWDRVRIADDDDGKTLSLLIQGSQTVRESVAASENLHLTISNLADPALTPSVVDDPITRTTNPNIADYIEYENLPTPNVPNISLWIDPETQIDQPELMRDIARARPMDTSAPRFLPKNISQDLFDSLKEVASDDVEKYFHIDETTSACTIDAKIFFEIEKQLKVTASQLVQLAEQRKKSNQTLNPEEKQKLADARAEFMGWKALSRLCDRVHTTEAYKANPDAQKKLLSNLLLTTAVDNSFRMASNTLFVDALAECSDRVQDGLTKLEAGYKEYLAEHGGLSVHARVEHRIEQAKLETLGKVATLEIFAKLKRYSRQDDNFQEIHVKQTLEFKAGKKLRMTSTPPNCVYTDPDIKDDRVDRAVQVVEAMERGDKTTAAKLLNPLIQEAEEGIVIENQRIAAKNVTRVSLGQQPIRKEKPLSKSFKNIDTWLSEKESITQDLSLGFNLRKAFPEAFAARSAILNKESEALAVPPKKEKDQENWKVKAEHHAKVVEKADGQLSMSLVQIAKLARNRVREQLIESREIYVVHAAPPSVSASAQHPTAMEDFYKMDVQIAKEIQPSIRGIEIDAGCKATHMPHIWVAGRALGMGVKGYVPQSKDHENLEQAMVRGLDEMSEEKMREHFEVSPAESDDVLGELLVVKIDKEKNAFLKPDNDILLIKVNAADVKGLPLKSGEKTPTDFSIGTLRWSNDTQSDNTSAVKAILGRIDSEQQERNRLERAGERKVGYSSSAVSDSRVRFNEVALKTKQIETSDRYNQLLFLKKNEEKNNLFAVLNANGEEELRVGKPIQGEELVQGDIFSFDKGKWQRITPSPSQTKTKTNTESRSSSKASRATSPSPEIKKSNLDEHPLLKGDRKQLEVDAGIGKGTTIEVLEWDGKALYKPITSITSNGAFIKMDIGQSATPKIAFWFMSNAKLQQLGLLDAENKRTTEGDKYLQKGNSLPKKIFPSRGHGI